MDNLCSVISSLEQERTNRVGILGIFYHGRCGTFRILHTSNFSQYTENCRALDHFLHESFTYGSVRA